MMQDADPLYQYVRQVMLEIMAVLWVNGQTTLHVGAMMRLLGVPEDEAKQHDDVRLDLSENYAELAKYIGLQRFQDTRVPNGATIH